jgi:hypothetical protein
VEFFLHFMVLGGWGMWLVLSCGLASFAQAISFGTRPTSAARDALSAFSRATLMSIPAAIALSLAHMGAKVPNIPELANNPRFDLVVMEGLIEAISPAILGFSMLCFVWIIAAIGERRLRS